MSFIGDDRKALALRGCEFLHRLEGERKGLNCADDDLLATGKRFSEFAALAGSLTLDRRDDSTRATKIKDRLLQLGIKHSAIGHDENGVKELFMLRGMQIGKEVRGPRDRVGFAGAR